MCCHCFAHLRALMLCIIMSAAAAAEEVPAPPVPPAPPSPPAAATEPQSSVLKHLRFLIRGQTQPSAVYLRDDVQDFVGGSESRVPEEVPPPPPSPPAPPTPAPAAPRLSRFITHSLPLPPPLYVHDGPYEPRGPHLTMDSLSQTQYCPGLDPETCCPRGCGGLGSDAFAGGATDEALPECCPLPCLIEARWRHEPVSPEFVSAAPEAPATSECSPSLGVCFPNADKMGHGPGCLEVQRLPEGPAPVQTARHTPRPPVPHVVRIAAAAPESPQPLTQVQHLQKAAEHLEAAGHPDEAQHLRERAADLQRHARQRLQELREHKRKIEEEIQELESITGAADQVQIRVSMLEVDEQKLQESGIDFRMPTAMKSATGAPLPPTGQPLVAFDLRPVALAAEQLRALRECGAAKVLAEPTVVTTNGREATVFSGGEVPIAIPQGKDEVQVEWKECGVRLTATPQMLEDGRLRLDIASEVSERDFGNAEAVHGHRVPGIISRRFHAQVVTRFGETLVIGGLSRQDQPHASVAQMLKKIPDQQRLFRPASSTATEQTPSRSLVVFVTAEPMPSHSTESADHP